MRYSNKIKKAVDSMINNEKLITNVIKSQSDEFFFNFNNKSNWGIIENEKLFSLFYYPQELGSLEELAKIDGLVRSELQYMQYKDDSQNGDLNKSLGLLIGIVQDRLYGINEVLEDIISLDELPF